MNIKHSKYKNTGILFELLVRQITSDTLSGIDSKAANILKKYFTKTELGREYKLYESISKNTNVTETRATVVIDTLLENSKHLNRSALKRQKYNLIKEIKDNYNLEEFFRTKLPNYKAQAALYTLIESINSQEFQNPNQIIENKNVLLEYLTYANNKVEISNTNEFDKQDKDIKTLAYKLLLEKFNSKYANLNTDQKLVLKEFINSVDSTSKLKDFYNTKISEIKTQLGQLKNKVSNKAIQIKLTEVISILPSLGKNDKIGDEHLVNLLQYYQLVDELKTANG